MPDTRAAACSTSLVDVARTRLQALWGSAPVAGLTWVDLVERAVFTTRLPIEATPVCVKADRSECRSAQEAAVLRALHKAGVPVPRVLDHLPGAPAMLILEQISGHPLDQRAPATAWTLAGRALRAVHQVPAPPQIGPFAHTGTLLSEFLTNWTTTETSRAREAALLLTHRLDQVERALTDTFSTITEPDRACLLHGDYQPDHILTDQHRTRLLAVLDLGDASVGNPLWDLAVLTAHHPHRLADVLAGYEPSDSLRNRINQHIKTFQQLRHLGAANWLHTHRLNPTTELASLTRAMAGN